MRIDIVEFVFHWGDELVEHTHHLLLRFRRLWRKP